MDSTLDFIARLAELATLALQIYEDAVPFITKIKLAATTPGWQPTDADWAELDALEAPLRSKLDEGEPQ